MTFLHLVLYVPRYVPLFPGLVYGNLNRIYILLLCENCINLNYVELVHSAFQIYYILLCVCMLRLFSHVQLFATLWTVACQAPLSMGFSRQKYWCVLPIPFSGAVPEPGVKPWV